jgi:hypothetical protein
VALLAVVLVGACGSSKKNNTTANTTATTTATTEATTTTIATTTTAAPAATTTTVGQTITITPSTGLHDGQLVHVVGTGFTPGANNIGINECADKGNNTMAGDCDLAGTKVIVPDGSGKVTIDFAVKKGPFGGNKIVCSSAQPCLLSISQLVASPTEQASNNITFAG